ncbi:glutathione S-transferase family protein [Pseudorhizobium endolithicum]|uniref:Glutathione S-transferase family protein n=2 Tax=Pseudorhizobium endolithicum TaxID=1191678 RepID=A0ABN7JXL1_9HYPH|nr:glutathione S-transferase family protein [Pseudorhizobium endolithicum]
MERQVPLHLELVRVDPVDRNGELAKTNPLAKVPVLHTPDGSLYDSRVICRFIDRRGEGPSLYGSETADIWEILVLESLADGLMDAAVSLRYELANRPPELRWPAWVEAQRTRIDAALEHLTGRIAQLAAPHMGTIAVAAALEYLDFRHPEQEWRTAHPTLSEWVSRFAQEKIMQMTAYPST